jgi:hypothetical protein
MKRTALLVNTAMTGPIPALSAVTTMKG